MIRSRKWMIAVPVAGLFVGGAVVAASAQDGKTVPKQGGMSCCSMMGGMKGMMGMQQGKGGAASALPLTETVEGMTVTLNTTPAPPQPGTNRFEVRLKDARGEPVTDAKVNLALSMPSMNMGGPTVAAKHHGSGVYSTSANLSMAGPWQAKVSLARPGQRTLSPAFTFQALQKGASTAPAQGGMKGCPMMMGSDGMKDCPMMGSGHTH